MPRPPRSKKPVRHRRAKPALRRRYAKKKSPDGSKSKMNVNQHLVFNKMPSSTVRFVKTIQSASAYVGAGASQSSVASFTVLSMPDFSSISALYNRYKINKVMLTFTLRDNTSSGASLFAANMPKIYIRYNYDSENLTSSSSTATVQSKLQEMNNVQEFQFTPMKTQIQYSFVPRTIAPVYLSGLSTGYQLQPKRFIDAYYSGVQHYGIVWYADIIPTGTYLQVDLTYDVSFKYSE